MRSRSARPHRLAPFCRPLSCATFKSAKGSWKGRTFNAKDTSMDKPYLMLRNRKSFACATHGSGRHDGQSSSPVHPLRVTGTYPNGVRLLGRLHKGGRLGMGGVGKGDRLALQL